MLQTPPEFAPRHGIHDTNDAEGKPALYFVCQHSKLLVDCHTGALPTPLLAMQLAQASAPLLSIGEWREHHCLATWMHSDDPAPAGYAFVGLRTLLMESTMDPALLGIASRAIQIAEWARTHQFCGVCATPMQLLAGERAMRCPGCGMTAYPRISPAMMVLIKQGNAVLLARHTASPTGRFTPLAGFLEAGESIEEAIHREVMEEVGLTVTNIRYFGSQSWPFPHSLMIAFTADYVAGDITVDPTEIAEARWFGPQDLPDAHPEVSISGVLVNTHFAAARQAA